MIDLNNFVTLHDQNELEFSSVFARVVYVNYSLKHSGTYSSQANMQSWFDTLDYPEQWRINALASRFHAQIEAAIKHFVCITYSIDDNCQLEIMMPTLGARKATSTANLVQDIIRVRLSIE